MTDQEKVAMKDWVENWKKAGPLLEDIRIENIRASNLAETIAAFDAAFRSALFLHPPAPTSGLIEFHRIMAKSR